MNYGWLVIAKPFFGQFLVVFDPYGWTDYRQQQFELTCRKRSREQLRVLNATVSFKPLLKGFPLHLRFTFCIAFWIAFYCPTFVMKTGTRLLIWVCKMHFRMNLRIKIVFLNQDPEVLKKVRVHENSLGYARAEEWSPGLAQDARFSFLDCSLSNSTGSIAGKLSERLMDPAKISVGTDGTMHPSRSLDRSNH